MGVRDVAASNSQDALEAAVSSSAAGKRRPAIDVVGTDGDPAAEIDEVGVSVVGVDAESEDCVSVADADEGNDGVDAKEAAGEDGTVSTVP